MKKIAILIVAILCVTFTFKTTYASFPVAKHETSVSQEQKSTVSQEQVQTQVSQAEPAAAAAAGGGKSQLVALLLCGFLGGLGVHRFYLGYIWQGVVQLLTLGGCGIWSLIDFIRIITGSLVPKDGSYAKTL